MASIYRFLLSLFPSSPFSLLAGLQRTGHFAAANHSPPSHLPLFILVLALCWLFAIFYLVLPAASDCLGRLVRCPRPLVIGTAPPCLSSLRLSVACSFDLSPSRPSFHRYSVQYLNRLSCCVVSVCVWEILPFGADRSRWRSVLAWAVCPSGFARGVWDHLESFDTRFSI